MNTATMRLMVVGANDTLNKQLHQALQLALKSRASLKEVAMDDFEIQLQLYKPHLIFFVAGNLSDIQIQKALQIHERNYNRSTVLILQADRSKKIDDDWYALGATDVVSTQEWNSSFLARTLRHAIKSTAVQLALQAEENRYEHIFDQTKDIIYISNQQGHILEINPIASELLGYTTDEFKLMHAKDLYANPLDREKFERLMLRSGMVRNFEVELKKKNGERLSCLITSSLQHTADGTSYYLGIIHDNDIRKKTEEEKVQNEKLAVTGRIARTIAHEVRNPLTNINLSLEQLQVEVGENEDLQVYFDIIRRNGERINQLITELLDSAKPTELKLVKYSVNELIDETLKLAQDRIALKGIQVVKQYDQEKPWIEIDPEKMRIALLNVVINAVEAMPDKSGELIIKTSAADNQCQITIKDNGSGIEPEHLTKLFEPFFSSKQKGMGLGLTTTQNIIYNHRGSIQVESEPGKGTSFKIGFSFSNN